MTKNLIVLRCGQNSLHWQWLEAGSRNWDIILCPYQDIDPRSLESHLIPGQKWNGLYRFLNEFPAWRDYDYICLPDDDIAADGVTWNHFFDRCRAYQIDLAMPALTPDSYFSHFITLQNTEFLARSTTFVEIMNPCFSRDFLEAALPTLALSRSGTGFGLDFLWGFMLSYKNIWIIDETAVHHTRPVGSARDKILANLAKYDFEFIKGFGVPIASLSVLAGVDRDGRFTKSQDKDFDVKVHRGYAYLEQRNPNFWRDILSMPSQSPPEVSQAAIERLRRALAHITAPDRTISRGRPCLTSSVSKWSWSQDPALEATGANDGLLNGVCGFHTDLEVNPWWQIDLGVFCDITSIKIYNRLDAKHCCIDFDVLCSFDNRTWSTALSKRDGQLFGGLDGSPFQAHFSPALCGRFVRVQLAGHNFLHLDQIEIFGSAMATDDRPVLTPRLPDGQNSDRPDALVAESVIMFERLLSDPRGRFLLRRAIDEVIAKPTAEAALSAFFGLNHMLKDGADLRKVERLAAAIDSSNYLNSRMTECQRYNTATELLTAGMQARSIPDGLVLEFGVFSGKSINHIAALDTGQIFGFDSFEGPPEDWRPDIPRSAFKLDKLPEVARNVSLIKGWFEDTLPGFVKTHSECVSFLHVDCDLYSSSKTIFHYLRDQIVPGTVIVFDEYFNYVGWRNHEYKAFAEFLAEMGLSYRYIGAVLAHQQAGVVIC